MAGKAQIEDVKGCGQGAVMAFSVGLRVEEPENFNFEISKAVRRDINNFSAWKCLERILRTGRTRLACV